MLEQNVTIATILFLWIVSFFFLVLIVIPRRDRKILHLKGQLDNEKGMVSLLEKLNPEPKDIGWEFSYDENTNYVRRKIKHEDGTIENRSVCGMCAFFHDDKHYGYRIASLLNQGYVVASPEPERNMEVVFKDSLTVLHPNHEEHAQRINISKKHCSGCANIVCLKPDPMTRSDTLYFSCGFKHWLYKPLQYVETYATSIDCKDFEVGKKSG